MIQFKKNTILANKYRLISCLGHGSYGQVWLSEDILLNQIVALKIIPSPLKELVKNIKEAKIGHKFTHPHLIKIYNAEIMPITVNGSEAVLTLIAEEYHKNGTVKSLLNNHNFIDSKQLIKVLKEILLGLEHLHVNGIIHNDIKPANILIDNNGRSVLSDYGISGVSQNNSPIMAEDAYILHEAPETVLSGLIDYKTDIYQLGCTAYRLANGLNQMTEIIDSNNNQLYNNKIHFNAKFDNIYMPKQLIRIIQKAMAPQEKRYNSALEMRRDIEKLNYSGYWSDDPLYTQEIAGFNSHNIFRFHIDSVGRSFRIETTKQNKLSNKTTRVSKYCAKNLRKKDLIKMRSNLIDSVEKGII